MSNNLVSPPPVANPLDEDPTDFSGFDATVASAEEEDPTDFSTFAPQPAALPPTALPPASTPEQPAVNPAAGSVQAIPKGGMSQHPQQMDVLSGLSGIEPRAEVAAPQQAPEAPRDQSLLGPIYQGLQNMGGEMTSQNPLQLIAATAAGVPEGVIRSGQDVGNFALGLSNPLMQGLYALGAGGNINDVMAGKPVAGSDQFHPQIDLAEQYAGIPQVADIKKETPGFYGAGSFGGEVLAPGSIGVGKALKGLPVAEAAAEGALTGGAFGTMAQGARQYEAGGKLDLGQAIAQGGVPGALGGAALGSAAGVAGSLLGKKAGGEVAKAGDDLAKAEPPPEPKTPAGEAVDPNKQLDVQGEVLNQPSKLDELRKRFNIESAEPKPEEGLTAPPAQSLADVPQNKPEPTPPAELLQELRAPAPAESATTPKPASEASPPVEPEIPPQIEKQLSETSPTPQTPEIKPEAAPIPADAYHVTANKKFFVRKTANSKAEIVNVETGEVRKRGGLAEAKQSADRFDSGEATWGQGKRKMLEPLGKSEAEASKFPPGSKEWIADRVANGKRLDQIENLSPENRTLLEGAAQAKRDVDAINQEYKAAQEKFFEKTGKVPGSVEPTAAQRQELNLFESELVKDAGITRKVLRSPEVLQPLAASKPKATGEEFAGATTRRGQADVVKSLETRAAEAKAKLDDLRKQVHGAYKRGEIPDSVTIGDGDQAINFAINRDTVMDKLPDSIKERTQLEKERMLAGQDPRPDITPRVIDDMVKEIDRRSPGELDKDLKDYDNAESEQEILDGLMKKDRKGRKLMDVFTEELGKASKGSALSADPITASMLMTVKAAEKTAQSAEGKAAIANIKTMISDHKTLNGLRLLRRSSDVLKGASREVHGVFRKAMATEARLFQGVEVKPEHYDALDKAVSNHMSEAEIRNLDLPEEMKDLAILRRDLRQNTATHFDELIDKMEAFEGKDQAMIDDLKIISQMRDSLRAGGSITKQDTLGKGMSYLNQAFNDWCFRWNPAFNLLNRTDPWTLGSSAIGLGRVGKAISLQLQDQAVKDFANSFNFKGVFEQARMDYQRQMGKSIAEKVTEKVPVVGKATKNDLPSENWNINDMFIGGLIHHAEKNLGIEDGTAWVKDLASGKITDEEAIIDAIAHAQSITNDVTGAGYFGIDRDFLGQSPVAGGMFQFLSQPLRTARMQIKHVEKLGNPDTRKAALGALASLYCMQVAMGGEAAIPQEVAQTWENIHPESLNAFENILEAFEVQKYITGRDLSDKLRYSIMPLTKFGMKAVFESGGKAIAHLEGKEYDKALQQIAFSLVPTMFGVGGGTIKRATDAYDNVQKGEKEVSVYANSVQDAVAPKRLGSIKQKYGPLDGLADVFLPGENARSPGPKMDSQGKPMMDKQGKPVMLPSLAEQRLKMRQEARLKK